jgi:hypothetical protein
MPAAEGVSWQGLVVGHAATWYASLLLPSSGIAPPHELYSSRARTDRPIESPYVALSGAGVALAL